LDIAARSAALARLEKLKARRINNGNLKIDITPYEKVLQALSLAARSASIFESISKWKVHALIGNRT
jgi:hypothetical protein